MFYIIGIVVNRPFWLVILQNMSALYRAVFNATLTYEP